MIAKEKSYFYKLIKSNGTILILIKGSYDISSVCSSDFFLFYSIECLEELRFKNQ